MPLAGYGLETEDGRCGYFSKVGFRLRKSILDKETSFVTVSSAHKKCVSMSSNIIHLDAIEGGFFGEGLRFVYLEIMKQLRYSLSPDGVSCQGVCGCAYY